MTTAISIRNLTKHYRNFQALTDLSLDVPHGSIFGFLGPNGAGKSTTIRILAGLSQATSGLAMVNGVPVTPEGLHRRHLGYIAQEPRFYGWMTGRQVMEYAASFHGGIARSRLDDLLERVGIAGAANRPCRTYSGGMRQRLGIAQALVGKPAIVVLDEPVSAMDPVGRAELLDLMRSLRGETTVFYSTHILEDVERLSDYVAILNHGQLITTAPTQELLGSFTRGSLRVTVAGTSELLTDKLLQIPNVLNVTALEPGDSIWVYHVQANEAATPQVQREITHLVATHDLTLISNEALSMTLEDVFLQLINGSLINGSPQPFKPEFTTGTTHRISTAAIDPVKPIETEIQVTPIPIAEPKPIPELVPKKRRRFRFAWLVGLFVMAIATTGGWYAYQTYFKQPATPPAAVTLVPVTRSDVEISVTESGTVELGGQQTLTAPREATVDQVKVKEGDRVQKGQVLLVLRDRIVQENIRDQQLSQAKFKIDYDRAQEKLTEAQTKLKETEKRLQETQELVEGGFLSDTDLQADKSTLDGNRSALRDAQVEMQKMDLDRQSNQQKLEALQRQLQDTAIVSPIDGLVLSLNVANGAGVRTEAKLLSLGDPNQEMIQLQLAPLNAAKVRVNQAARVQMVGPTPKVFTGRIVSLSPQASLGDPNMPSMNAMGQATVAANVLLDRPSNTLIPGSMVSVEIITEQRRNVIAVTPDLIQQGSPEPFVWMKDAQGNAKQQPITLGLIGLQIVEVTSGLNAGDEIVIPPVDTALMPGVKLNIPDLNTTN
ncbi:MAG: efflux RND transporter periplasmic adaptor subunit [Oculatellaceae cyanobacterium Prado106]|jgi:RND family efflux transporter MFP subunit|nr:efflux RND transporter periplasmic adaptor subunit [Oculatellaceae cyanobacterium Prado106]